MASAGSTSSTLEEGVEVDPALLICLGVVGVIFALATCGALGKKAQDAAVGDCCETLACFCWPCLLAYGAWVLINACGKRCWGRLLSSEQNAEVPQTPLSQARNSFATVPPGANSQGPWQNHQRTGIPQHPHDQRAITPPRSVGSRAVHTGPRPYLGAARMHGFGNSNDRGQNLHRSGTPKRPAQATELKLPPPILIRKPDSRGSRP